MKNLILIAALSVASIAGSLAWTETADARPRGWYGAPVARYYRPYYRSYYRPYYGYRSYYGPRFYAGYPYRYSYRPYYGGGYYYGWW